MIYARKVLEKNGCIIYLAADIKCLDYHTPCSLTADIYMQIISGNNDDIICSFEVTAGDLAALYKAIDLRWYNRTLPVYR